MTAPREQAGQALKGLAPHDHRLAHGQRLEALEVGGKPPGQVAFMADRAVRGDGVNQHDLRIGVLAHEALGLTSLETRVTCPILRPSRASRLP